jgi:phage tail-like protein
MSQLPPIPRPPLDPTSLLCDQRVGWPVLRAEDTAFEGGAATLARSPGSLRWLTEPSGSFGGLRPPANVAVCGDAIWLLDPGRPALLRFDPCSCEFDEVPCFVGEGSGPREVRDARGIAAAGNHLFVCDAGNHRLAVFVLLPLALAGLWRPPASALGPGSDPWHPTGVAVDARGTVLVADDANGMIHRFTAHGSYLGHWDGFGASTHVAVGRDGAVYAAGALDAFRAGPDGTPEPVTSPADDLASAFPPTPFAVDAEGRISLGPLCAPPTTLVVDAHGHPVSEEAGADVDRYERRGSLTLGPLDSRIDRCSWHRVILRGELPEGCGVEVATFTSEIDLPSSELDQLPEHAWETQLQATAFQSGEWDGLVRSTPGRFLWIRLGLTGNGRSTPRLGGVETEFPRISLRRFLPAVYDAEPRSADFTDRFLALFDRPLRDTEHAVDDAAALYDPLSTPALSWLASWVGIELDRQVPEAVQRGLVKRWAETAPLRGTRYGLWRVLVAYLGLDGLTTICRCDEEPGTCRPPRATCPPTPPHRWTWEVPRLILEHYQLRRWLELGVGRLGDQAVLWGRRIVNRSQLGDGAEVGITQLTATQDPLRDPFHVFAHRFTVFVPASAGATPERRRALERLIARERPAHTEGHVEYVEARFRIGVQSMIGLDAVVAGVPHDGITLGDSSLHPGSVLGGSPAPVVDSSRIGTTAVLD